MEDLVCPECNAPLDEKDLRESLVCKHCKTNLRDPKYLDFLELLVYHDIVDDIDFFDMSLYGDQILKEGREDYDEPEIDPAKFEKHKEIWDEFEDDVELQEDISGEENIDNEAWNIFDSGVPADDWEEDEEENEDNSDLDTQNEEDY